MYKRLNLRIIINGFTKHKQSVLFTVHNVVFTPSNPLLSITVLMAVQESSSVAMEDVIMAEQQLTPGGPAAPANEVVPTKIIRKDQLLFVAHSSYHHHWVLDSSIM